ncbi:MAG: hypothetical protein JW708_01265 [Vallitaleaceae bacterium]|nr:hypothetical protein [Vallitaleaceae bacterium]
MSPINAKAIEKLMEAKRLEKEALLSMLPENMQKHIDVIGKEIKAMVVDCFFEESQETHQDPESHKNSEPQKGQATSKVKKVDIG